MNNLAHEELDGTYWTPPEALNIEQIHHDLRAALVGSLGRRGHALLVMTEGSETFEFYIAGTVDMASCVPVGCFTIAVDRKNNRACGVCLCDGEIGVTEPMRFPFKGDVDIAFADFYRLARDEGHVS